MKKYIETYHNGKQLLGSDFTLVINNNLGAKAIKNRIEQMGKRIELLKNIKPFLKSGTIEIKVN
jgi:hypothetical protein